MNRRPQIPVAVFLTRFEPRGGAGDTHLHLMRQATIRQVPGLARWCRHVRIAAVHPCDFYTDNFDPTARDPRLGRRWGVSPDGTPARAQPARQACRCATKVVANSPALRRVLAQEGPGPALIAAVPRGLDAAAHHGRSTGPTVRPAHTLANAVDRAEGASKGAAARPHVAERVTCERTVEACAEPYSTGVLESMPAGATTSRPVI